MTFLSFTPLSSLRFESGCLLVLLQSPVSRSGDLDPLGRHAFLFCKIRLNDIHQTADDVERTDVGTFIIWVLELLGHIIKMEVGGTSLVVQRLRVCAGGAGSIPGQGNKIPHATWPKKKKKELGVRKCGRSTS